MCRRTTGDPLVKAFLERYRLNLLTVPREGVDCGDVYVQVGTELMAPGSIAHLTAPTFELPDIYRDEVLSDLEGLETVEVEASVGLNFTAAFLGAFGGGGLGQAVKTHYEEAGIRRLKFRAGGVTRDRVDTAALGSALTRSPLLTDHPMIHDENRYYVVVSVVRSDRFTIEAFGRGTKAVDVDTSVLGDTLASARVATASERAGEVSYIGDRHLAIGVELIELAIESDGMRFRPVATALKVRGESQASQVESVYLGGGEGHAFVDLPTAGSRP